MATSNATPTNTPVDTVKAAVAKVAAKTRAVKKPAVKARPVKAAAVKAPAKTAAAKPVKKVAAKAPTLKQVAHKGTRKVTSVVHMTRDASFKLIDSQRSIWLAGLGALAKVTTSTGVKGEKAFEALVKAGEKFEAQARGAIDSNANMLKGRISDATNVVDQGIGDRWRRVRHAHQAGPDPPGLWQEDRQVTEFPMAQAPAPWDTVHSGGL
jgi:poly(hydroxyalkanoate) granule-associated protein